MRLKENLRNFITNIFARRQYARLVKELALPKINSILDVGCSGGLLLDVIYSVFKEKGISLQCTGIDIDKETIRKAKRRYPHIQFKVGDAKHISYRKNSFDLVLCKDVLHHDTSPTKLVNTIKRVGKYYVLLEANKSNYWLSKFKGHDHFSTSKFKRIVSPQRLFFIDLFWPPPKIMALFVFSPFIPTSKKAFIVGTNM